MGELGECTLFLSVNLKRNRTAKNITLTHRDYIENKLTEYGMSDLHQTQIM